VGDAAGLGDDAAEGEPELPHADKTTADRATKQVTDSRFNRTSRTETPHAKGPL